MKQILFIISLCVLSLMPAVVTLAQETNATADDYTFSFIVDFPRPAGAGVGAGEDMSAEDFVKVLYALAISIAGLLAVVKIIYAGVQYMLTDVVTSKGKAKKDIEGAILGLVIVLAAVFILETINPQLSTLNIFRNAQGVSEPGPGSQSAITTPNGVATSSTSTNLPANAICEAHAIQCSAGWQPIRTCAGNINAQATGNATSPVCTCECRPQSTVNTGNTTGNNTGNNNNTNTNTNNSGNQNTQ